MTRLQCLRIVFICLGIGETLSSEPLNYNINTKKWIHVLDDHFISVTINPTDLLQGKAFGLGMNSTLAILKGLSPAYIRVGSADTNKYTFKRSRYPTEVSRTEDEFIVTESHWMIFNNVAQSAGLDVIVCLNAAHRNGGGRKWDTRNSLELISFSDSQGYNLTFQLGYEVQKNLGISGHQYGRDLKRLRTILNAFPRYQNSKLIGPDIKVLHKKEDIEFANEVLVEAGSTLDAVTWHPRWPQPSKMKVSDISELGYEFPSDYFEWDRSQLNKILQRSISKNPVWIGESKTESTGTFAEGLLFARRLVLAAKLGVEVVMKQPSLMDISHPKPEYWIAFLHKRLLGKAVLETRAMNNQSEITAIAHCTNPFFWAEKPDKNLEGSVTIHAVNMGGKEQKMQMKGIWNGKSQVIFQYLLTSGTDPDSVFSQMTYLNGEPLMMTDGGNLPDIIPRIRRLERGVILKLPPYSIGYWVVPEARVKVCQSQPSFASAAYLENFPATSVMKNNQKSTQNIRNLNQYIVDKLKNPISGSDEENYDDELFSDIEKDDVERSSERRGQRSSRRIREITVEDIGQELKKKIREIRVMLENKGSLPYDKGSYPSETLRAAEEKITSLTDELGAATRMTNQQEEFGRFLHHSGLNQDFGILMMNERLGGLQDYIRRSPNENNLWNAAASIPNAYDSIHAKTQRFRRSLYPEDDYEEGSTESYSSEEEVETETRPYRKINYGKGISRLSQDSDESSDYAGHSGFSSLRGIEEGYKNFISNRIQDEKNKLSDTKRPKEKNETEESKNSTARRMKLLGNDLQEEILMKEIEVLQKTEEVMANFIKNHKKRQETIEEIILHEISDIKEDRLTALEDLRLQKETAEKLSENFEHVADGQDDIPKKMRRSVLQVLQHTFDLDPNQKIKRSIEGVDANVNSLTENHVEKKNLKIIKRSLESPSSSERSLRMRKRRRSHRVDDDSEEESRAKTRRNRSERLERMKNFIQSRERIRDRNIQRKKSRRSNRKYKSDGNNEEDNEILSNYRAEFVENSSEEQPKGGGKEMVTSQKLERRVTHEQEKQKEPDGTDHEETSEQIKKKKEVKKSATANNGMNNVNNNDTSAFRGSSGGEGNANGSNSGNSDEKSKGKDGENEKVSNHNRNRDFDEEKTLQKMKSEETREYVPLKIDKDRGLKVLKKISNLVENINMKERSRTRNPSVDVEDMSEEFYNDAISKLMKKRHRRSHDRKREGEYEEKKATDVRIDEPDSEANSQDFRALRKEIKLRKLLDRITTRRKLMERVVDDDLKNLPENSAILRLKAKLQGKSSGKPPLESPTKSAEEILEQNEPPLTVATTERTASGSESKTESQEKNKPQQIHGEQSISGAIRNFDSINKPEENSTNLVSDIAPIVPGEINSENDERAGMTTVKEPNRSSSDVPQSDLDAQKQEMVDSEEDSVLVVPEIYDSFILDPIVVVPTVNVEQKHSGGTYENVAEEIGDEYRDVDAIPSDTMTELLEQYREQPLTVVEDDVSEEARTDAFDQNDKSANSNRKRSFGSISNEALFDDGRNGRLPFFGVQRTSGYASSFPLLKYNPRCKELVSDAKIDLMHKQKEDEYADECPEMRTEMFPLRTSIENNLDSSDVVDRSIVETVPSEIANTEKSERKSENDESSISNIPSNLRIRYGQRGPEDAEIEDFGEIKRVSDAGMARLRRKRRGILDRRLTSPEERIQSFKRAMQGRHIPFKHRNELPISNDNDGFWKMAGSTVKAVFSDVIPDAYGKTKNKIENLGIAEYFKEFGKIVEQMKNLDRLFANIGQAAVRSYIKGSEDEKGDYIQTIENKRRSRRNIAETAAAGETDEGKTETENPVFAGITERPEENSTTDDTTAATAAGSSVISCVEATSAQNSRMDRDVVGTVANEGKSLNEHRTGKKIKEKSLKGYNKDGPNDLIKNLFLMDSNPGIVEVTKSPPHSELTSSTISLLPFRSRYNATSNGNSSPNKLFKRDNVYRSVSDANRSLVHKIMSEPEIDAPGAQKFSPWMKTTKDFINQALTTLQRQRELSEMIARESVNDLVKKEIEKRVIGKREAFSDGNLRHFFPVYQMPTSRKREVYTGSDEHSSRFLAPLQPGVYIVPTEEMKNLRSEQIMKEASPSKPGMPNMVTLNIYYDKKSPQEWELSKEEIDEHSVGKANSNYLKYYQPPSLHWNPVPIANHPDFITPLHEPADIGGRYVPAAHGLHALHSETKIHEPINSRILPHPGEYRDTLTEPDRGYFAITPRNSKQQSFYDAVYHPNTNQYDHQKTRWTDFKMRHPPVSELEAMGSGALDGSGWAVQFQPLKKKTSRNRQPLRQTERQLRPYSDKKRSIGNLMADPNFSQIALPLWKYFMSRKGEKESREADKTADEESNDSNSLEELFAENRKRAKSNGAKQSTPAADKTESDGKPPEEKEPEVEKLRKRRDLSGPVPSTMHSRNRDLVSERFGTIHDVDDIPGERRKQRQRSSRAVSLPNSLQVYRSPSLQTDDVISPPSESINESNRTAESTLKKIGGRDSSLEIPDEEEKFGKTGETGSKGVNNGNDALTSFFKHAYDSLIQMMKGMTDLI